MCVQLAVAYFAYLRWAVTVPRRGGHTAPTGPAALPPRGPRPPASIHALRPGTERHALPLVAPLGRRGRNIRYHDSAGSQVIQNTFRFPLLVIAFYHSLEAPLALKFNL